MNYALADGLLKLLDWPFLACTTLLIVIYHFRKQIAEVFGRGDIQITWGPNCSIRLRDLSESMDKELDPIHDEIQALRDDVTTIETNLKAGNAPSKETEGQDDLRGDREKHAKGRMKEALTNGKYLWRSIERLATIGAVSESQALDILRADPEVVFGTGKSGRQIARLASRSR